MASAWPCQAAWALCGTGSGGKAQGRTQAGELPSAKIAPFSPFRVGIHSKFLNSIGICLKHTAGVDGEDGLLGL